MKKIIFLLIMFVLASTFVYAGKSLPLDFESRDSYLVTMYKSDRVYFEFDGENHSIILDEIRSNRVELDIFLYQEMKLKHENPIYAFLDTSRELRVDADRDDIFDFTIKLTDFDSEKGLLEFTKVSIPKYNNSVPKGDDDVPKDDKEVVQGEFYQDKMFIGIISAIVLLLVVIYLVDNYIRRKKGVYF